MTPIEFGKQMQALGVRHALYTDVNRDGGLSGEQRRRHDRAGARNGLAGDRVGRRQHASKKSGS